MAASVRNDLENSFGQLISFSLLNVTLPKTIEASLIEQQVNKRKVETAIERQKIQQLQGQIEQVKNDATVSEANILAEANSYYDKVVKSAASDVNYNKYVVELETVKKATTGVFTKFFPAGKEDLFNKFAWYKKVFF